MSVALRLDVAGTGVGFLLLQFMQILDGPVSERCRDLYARQENINLAFKLRGADHLLRAPGVLAPGAMVVGVVEERGIPHLHHCSLAARTRVATNIRELEAAVAAYELVLLFGRDAGIAVAAVNESRESEGGVNAWSAILRSVEEDLHSVELRLCDHWLVFALAPPGASFRILEPPVIEGFAKDLVNCASHHRLAAHFACGSRAESPFVVRNVSDLRRRVVSGEHQGPHATDQGEALWVFDYRVFASLLVRAVQVARRSDARVPAVFGFRLETSLDVLAEVIHVFLGHAELYVHEENVVVLASVALSRGHHLDPVLFDGPDDGATVLVNGHNPEVGEFESADIPATRACFALDIGKQ